MRVALDGFARSFCILHSAFCLRLGVALGECVRLFLWPSLSAPDSQDAFSALRIPALRLLWLPVVAGGLDALVVRIQLGLKQNQRG